MTVRLLAYLAMFQILAWNASAQAPGQTFGPTLPGPRPERLMANFSGTPRTGAIPLLVSFTDESLGGPQSWFWEFGDGGTSTQQDPSHTYTVVGFYTVKLTVTHGPYTHTLTRTDYVHATDPPPIADFSAAPLAGVLPLSVAFTDLSSGGPRTGWSWTFGDGGTSTNQNPGHVYTQPGFYTVTLLASGPGGSDAETKTNYIHVLAPVPDISVDLPDFVMLTDIVEFTVTVTDPNDDLVTMRLLNPPPGMVLEPILSQPSPATVTGRWFPIQYDRGFTQLEFEAFNATYPDAKARERVQVEVFDGVGYEATTQLLVGDVTGDGVPDTIARGKWGEYLHVFAGKTTPDATPTATLTPPTNFQFNSAFTIFLVDVTGDGILDVMCVATDYVTDEVILVYAGGPQLVGNVTYSARLRDPAALSVGPSIMLASVTGSQYPDVVAYSVNNIAIFKTGPTMTGTRSPDARLKPPSGQQFQEDPSGPRPCGIADMTGDGVLDVLVVLDNINDPTPPQDSGHILIWKGGATLTGTPAAWADLTTSQNLEYLGRAWGGGDCCQSGLIGGSGWWIVDVDGDGLLDVLAGAPDHDVVAGGSHPDAGAIYVWRQIAAGAHGPSAVLEPPSPAYLERFPGRVLFHDVTGDGILDILAYSAKGRGVEDWDGNVLIWAGGASLVGMAPPPIANLRDLDPNSDNISDQQGSGAGQTFSLVDVTGDGELDVVISDSLAGGIISFPGIDWGAIRIYAGPTFLGDVEPSAVLEIDHQFQGLLNGAMEGHGMQLVDLNADGVTDILTGSFRWDVGSATDAGAIFFWAGGPALAGYPPPTATLTLASPLGGERLGTSIMVTGPGENAYQRWGVRFGIMLGDVTGDGLRDIVAASVYSDVGGAADTGGVFVWAGGPALSGALTPTASLTLTGASSDNVGFVSGQAIQLADVTNDGILDVVSGTYNYDGAKADTGAFLVWPGGPTLTGYQGSPYVFTVPGTEVDRLGFAKSTQGLRLADVTGDGIPDLIGSAPHTDVGGVDEAGAIYLFRGPLSASAAPIQKLYYPGAPAHYLLSGQDN
ncbi:MAG: PKD domain-containing protein [Planctomycetota bacterium]